MKDLNDFSREWLECPYNAEELSECTDVHFREVVLLELAKVTVVADDVGGSGDDGTIDELVVVGLGLDEIESVGGCDVLHVGSIGDCLDDKGRELTVARHLHQYLLVFKEYLRADAKCVATLTEGLPDVMPVGAWHKDGYEAVGVKYDFHL